MSLSKKAGAHLATKTCYLGTMYTIPQSPKPFTMLSRLFAPVAFALLLNACASAPEKNSGPEENALDITGTWHYLSSTTIQDGDTSSTIYGKDQEGMKTITDTHFTFLLRDKNNGADSAASFVAGGGRVSLEGNKYIEFLDYCNYREWEGSRFEFEVELKGDTLIQKGAERVESLNVERTIIETYLRAKRAPAGL